MCYWEENIWYKQRVQPWNSLFLTFLLSIPFNKLPCVPDKKPTVFVREHSLKLQQSWSRISAGNKCIWACNLYSILIVFCLFFLCLIVYYTTYHCLLHTYNLFVTSKKRIHQFTNLKCCKKAREPFKTPF